MYLSHDSLGVFTLAGDIHRCFATDYDKVCAGESMSSWCALQK